MKDRIFINNDQEQYSDMELNMINLGTLTERLAAMREADTSLPPDVLDQIRALDDDNWSGPTESELHEATSGEGLYAKLASGDVSNLTLAEVKEVLDNPEYTAMLDDDQIDELKSMDGMLQMASSNKEAKKGMPDAFKDWTIENGKPVKKTDDDDDEVDAEAGLQKKGGEKVAFTKLEHINDEALEAAKTAGNEPLFKAILAARDAYRRHTAAKVAAKLGEQTDKEAKLAKRSNYRMKLVAAAESAKLAVAAATKGNATTAAEESPFKSVEAMSNKEREAFIRKAQKAGFTPDYIDAMLGVPVSVETQMEVDIKEVMASSIPENVRVAAAKGLIKEAKLDSEQVSRLKRYWKDELGYGDAQWIDDLFDNK